MSSQAALVILYVKKIFFPVLKSIKIMAGHSHRSSVKNGHKAFKSRHASKGSIKNRVKGKIEKEGKSIQKPKKGASKLERKNLSKQLRENKIQNTLESRKVFDGNSGVDRVVTVIPLVKNISSEDIVSKLIQAGSNIDDDLTIFEGPCVKNVRMNKFKSNLKFILPDMNDFISILDAAKVSDFVVFGLSGTEEVDSQYGEQIIRALELQGIGHSIGVVSNLSEVHPKQKFQDDVKQSLSSFFKHFFPTQDKIYNLENSSDSLVAIRTLCQKFPKSITWRDSRGWLIADSISYIEDNNEGYLKIEGTVRGIGFNSNKLVHLPGFGDYQIARIEKNNRNEIDEFNPNENQELLDELAPQELEMEDWDDEEYNDDEFVQYDNNYLPSQKSKPKKLNLPEGTSDYQARWYLEDDVVSDDESDDGSDEEIMEDDEKMDIEEDYEGEELQDDNDEFVELTPEEEERQLELYRQKENEDREFPDEIELNPLESGKERLKRYRGLKNLHNTHWDCDEFDPNRPNEWKRLLRISNYKGTKNKVLKDSIIESQVLIGSKINLYLKAPKLIIESIEPIDKKPFIVYGLLEHEQKLAVVNFSIKTWEEYDKPIPSKERIIVQYGPRRQVIQPLFSSTTNTPNNVHKYDRFLHKDTIQIATAIAPVSFSTSTPALFFKETSSGIEFVGSGTFLNAEHQRILAKRVILTGHPLSIHKNVVTVRYMFFNSEDISYYKAVPLFTKSGRSGFIKESLGTHGYFKANFDGKITSQDVIAMSLYKRVWPKTSTPWSR